MAKVTLAGAGNGGLNVFAGIKFRARPSSATSTAENEVPDYRSVVESRFAASFAASTSAPNNTAEMVR